MTDGTASTPTATAWPVRSTDTGGSGVTPVASVLPTESWGEKLFAALPLFFVGGACLAVAIDLYYTGITGQFGANRSVHLELWALFLALAVTGLAAGVFAMLVEDEFEEIAPVVVPVAEPSPPVPEWDESAIKPEEEPSLLGPRPWERYPNLTEGPVADAAPTATVLSQLDEIEASLRKRPRPPTPE